MATNLDISAILEKLPHRFPFLLIDRVEEIDVENKTLVAIKNVSVNEPQFTGHWPDMPVMPGVLMLEAMAQAIGILAMEIGGIASVKDTDKTFFLSGFNNVRFRAPVIPGDQLIIHASVKAEKRGIWKTAAEMKVKDTLVCSADVTLALRDMKSDR